MSFELQRSRVLAIEEGHPVHVGCYGEWVWDTGECERCGKRVSNADVVFPTHMLPSIYKTDVDALLRRIDELEDEVAQYEDVVKR
jgi:hypothetical protein